MRLKAFLRARGLSVSAAARQTGVKHETFRKWVNGERVPRATAMRAVMEWSGGMVTANDFCGCGSAESPVTDDAGGSHD